MPLPRRIGRRPVLARVALLAAVSRLPSPLAWVEPASAAAMPGRSPLPPGATTVQQALAALENRHGGRLGVAFLDIATGIGLSYRGDERFPMCSTYKAIAAAGVLAKVDRGQDRLDRLVVFTAGDIVPYSPATGSRSGPPGLTLDALCEAAVTLSDNTAGNLLLDCLGGPAGFTGWLRQEGDAVTRLDRIEPALNAVARGDDRDTTTPLAMAHLLHRLVLGDVLSASSRQRLAAWLVACRTGGKRLRADLPPGWRAGDKTGGGDDNATNDIAVFWPAQGAPIVATAFYIGCAAAMETRESVLAEVGRLAMSGWAA